MEQVLFLILKRRAEEIRKRTNGRFVLCRLPDFRLLSFQRLFVRAGLQPLQTAVALLGMALKASPFIRGLVTEVSQDSGLDLMVCILATSCATLSSLPGLVHITPWFGPADNILLRARTFSGLTLPSSLSVALDSKLTQRSSWWACLQESLSQLQST